MDHNDLARYDRTVGKTTILANDLKKGDLVTMKGTGWKARIESNKKGIIKDVFVWGFEAEYGSCYAWEIAGVTEHLGQPVHLTVELSPAQIKQMAAVRKAGF